ncbi:hypothetical protein A5844_000372 [Enterococcus sp. 10A9_DIV0425]|uniref:Helicase Helix-turn-helix domain-containing protein n=1 Tax=Candidatus Enterococcus wittei TaxID=1987383 RepID=A0A2C9XRW9_9ENTE|nr:helix-turn-helix domain-containing protein [Enterococcus sp. 10A9_DIV0425]OTP12156.1 hypothetical protein A5844_000372 [Enterococcus sp. 10A9_DIV0425]
MTEFILSLFSSRDKLRVSTLFHLLSGKRTSSVLLYGFFHGLLFIHGSFPTLKQSEFFTMIEEMTKENLLYVEGKDVKLTPLGKKQLEEQSVDLTGLQYDKYGRTDNECWRLIKFAVQVVSQLAADEQKYLPVETSPFYSYQIKRWLKEANYSRRELAEGLYQELTEIFLLMPRDKADFLANQFSGNSRIGLLDYQLIKTKDDTKLKFFQDQCVHLLLAAISKHKPFLLKLLIQPLLYQNHNQSMLVTRQMVQEGLSVEQIMARRRLKRGTINDHLIEWAIFFDDFPYEQIVSKKTRNILSHVSQPIITLNYRDVNIGDLDYGEFRLYQIEQLKGEITNELN